MLIPILDGAFCPVVDRFFALGLSTVLLALATINPLNHSVDCTGKSNDHDLFGTGFLPSADPAILERNLAILITPELKMPARVFNRFLRTLPPDPSPLSIIL
jgi:hypothetical protein